MGLMFDEIFREELEKESVFTDASKLLPDYLPEKLPCREEEYRQLVRFFKPLLETRCPQRVLITGKIGVGKTALARRFGQEIERVARKSGMNLDYIHINCRGKRTSYSLLLTIVHRYFPRWPSRGVGEGELLSMLTSHLNNHDVFSIIALDEIDYFVQLSGSDVLYSLTRVSEESGTPGRISLIAISRNRDFLKGLDAPTQGTFLHNVLELNPYTADQLEEILKYRMKEAFKRGRVQEDVIPLIAEIASRSGDARFALELLFRAGMIADEEKSKVVLPEHVRAAKASVLPELRKDAMGDLTLHELLVLLALVRRLKTSNRAYVLTGELEKSYHLVCEELKERPRQHSRMLSYLYRLRDLGFVEVQPTTIHPKGQTQKISLEEVPARELEKEVEKVLESLRKEET